MAIPISQRLRLKPVPNTPEERGRRLSICETCPHAVLTVRGACQDCGKAQTVTSNDEDGWPCKGCGGQVHARPDKKLDFEMPRCGACGCPLASRTKYHSLPGHGPVHCPKGKW